MRRLDVIIEADGRPVGLPGRSIDHGNTDMTVVNVRLRNSFLRKRSLKLPIAKANRWRFRAAFWLNVVKLATGTAGGLMMFIGAGLALADNITTGFVQFGIGTLLAILSSVVGFAIPAQAPLLQQGAIRVPKVHPLAAQEWVSQNPAGVITPITPNF